MVITRLLPPKLVAIADAIRNKTGETELMQIDDMPENIDAIKQDQLASFLDGTLTQYENSDIVSITEQYRTFRNQKNLITVDLPNVTGLPGQMFEYCTNLVSANIPNLAALPNNMFNGCTQLDHFICNASGLTAQSTFNNCTNLKYLQFNKTIIQFNNTSIPNCPNLNAIILPNISNAPQRVAFALANTNFAPGGTGIFYVPENVVNIILNNASWSGYTTDQIKPLSEIPEEYQN